MDDERRRFEKWLERGYASGMEWLKRNPHFRASPQLLYPQCRSAIIVSVSYFTEQPPPPEFAFGRVARYAVGKDYHAVLRARLRELRSVIEKEIGRPLLGKACTDDVALLEQAFASRHGLGFSGKNTMIIGPKLSGSYYFVAELFTDLALEPDEAYKGTCGACFRCGDACPTRAIVNAGELDAGRCISYLTIENKGGTPMHMRESLGSWFFGCDICQEVCPYNQRPPETQWTEFLPQSGVGHYVDLLSLIGMNNEEQFNAAFAHTPLRRPKLRGLKRNAFVVLGNHLGERIQGYKPGGIDPELLVRRIENDLIGQSDPMLREHAAWALAQSRSLTAKQALHRALKNEPDPDIRQAMKGMC